MEQTLKNLVKAWIGESQARNRYGRYAKIAKKEGYVQIAALFLETAENEREHASMLWKLIQKLRKVDELVVDAAAPLKFGSTAENLKAAIEGEHYENTVMYPEFADVAESEGLQEIADRLRAIGRAEIHHEERYNKLLMEVENGTVFKKEREVEWVCRECGYVHKGHEPPERCPSCDHAKNYYQVKSEDY